MNRLNDAHGNKIIAGQDYILHPSTWVDLKEERCEYRGTSTWRHYKKYENSTFRLASNDGSYFCSYYVDGSDAYFCNAYMTPSIADPVTFQRYKV